MDILFLFLVLILSALLISFFLFCFVFYVPPGRKVVSDEIQLPPGKIYEPFWEKIRTCARETRDLYYRDMSITSFDGLKLYGKYYESIPGAPIEIMFHGYRGSAERDLPAGVQRSFLVGHNVLLVDQRCSGRSEGNVITFGIREYRDCLAWIEYLITCFGSDVKIILTGISMGASTVLMASGKPLPSNVIGVLADCGFHSAKDIIIHVASQMHLPAKMLYPFVKFGARVFGHFNLEEYSPEEAMKTCAVPVIFFHGLADDYVPSYMSRINYDACNTRKKLILIPGAGHGLSYLVSPDQYLSDVVEFFASV